MPNRIDVKNQSNVDAHQHLCSIDRTTKFTTSGLGIGWHLHKMHNASGLKPKMSKSALMSHKNKPDRLTVSVFATCFRTSSLLAQREA